MKPYSKKFLAGVLLFSLVLPSATTFATNQTDSTTYAKLQEQGVKADQEVKVIVETSDKAAIEREPNVKSARFSKAVKASEAEVKKTSENIKTKLNKENVKVDKEDEFSAVITGFSAKVKAKDIDKLRKQPGVKKVTTQMKAERPKGGASPNLASAPGMIKADTLWDQYKFSGQGMLISIIDTGVDPDHKDMKLSPKIESKYNSEDEVNKVIKENGLKGKWYNNKVPYGYNYADESQEIRDSGIGGYHGMHVAGIVAANGDAENEGVKGVAPNAQLLAMKVFSNDALVSTVYEEVWLKAIDDSVKLGADVLNMSLGMGSGYSREGVSPTNEAFNKAKAAGVVCAVAMGNDRVTNWGGEGKTNLAINPDFGTTGHPAVADPSYAVASMENIEMRGRVVEVEGEGQPDISAGTAEGENEKTTTEMKPYVYVGLGNTEEQYNGQDVTDKIVLAERGEGSFNDKAKLAKSLGAAGIIIYNSPDGNNLSFMSGMENKEFPSVFISNKDGEYLKKLLIDKPEQKINITPVHSVNNPKGGQMSEFSSWGITPDLRLKPDIAGVGGQIYSTINEDKYTMMSGTSMATPQVAGASALVMQRLYKDGFLNRTADGKPDPIQEYLTVLVMMNTATPVKDTEVDEASLYTPKQQGAGLVNLENVVKTYATVTATGGKDTKEDGKLELGEVGEQFNATFKLKNYSDKDITFTPKYISLRDEIKDGRYTEHSSVAKEQTLDPVTVKANSEETYTTTISTKGIDKNQFAQGYVMFVSDTNPTLSVPYTGFKGDWSEPQFLDNMPDFSKDVNYKPIEYPNGGVDKSGFMRRQEKGGWNYWNAWNVDGKPTVFVNSNKQEGMNSEVAPVITIMRNALDVKYDILDKDGKTLRNLFIDPILLKVNGLYKGGDNQYRFEYVPGGAAWDFKDQNGKPVDEGQYIYQITGHVDYKNAKEQKYQYNILLDNQAPKLSYKYDEDNRTIKVTAKDNLAGVFSVGYENTKTGEWHEQEVRKDPQFEDVGIVRDYSYTFKIADGFDLANLSIYAWDNSRNVAGENVDTGVKSDIKIKPIELKVGDSIPGIDQIKEHIEGLPKDAEVKILEKNFENTEKPGEYGIRVSVKVNGNETYYWIPVNVTAIKPIELTVGDDLLKTEQVKAHLDFLPEDAKVRIIKNVDTKEPGEFGLKVEVKIDGKKTYYTIPVIVKDKEKPEEPQPEQPEEKDETVYTMPVITVENPDYYAAFGKYEDKENPESYKKIHVQGNVDHIYQLDHLTLTITKDGKQVEGTEVQEIKVEKDKNGKFVFDHELDISGLEDGFVYELQLKVTGQNIGGDKLEDTIIRRIRKDFIAPTIEYTVEREDEKSPMAKIKVKGHENMTYLEMYFNESMLSRVDKTWDAFELEEGVDGEFEIEVPLEVGENKFEIKAYDDAGNETIEEVTIKRKDPNAVDPVDTTDLLNNLLKAHSIVSVPEKYDVTDEQLAELEDLIEQARKAISEQQPQDKVDEINNKLKEALANIKEKEAEKVDKKELVGQKEDAEELLKKKDDYKLDEKQEKALQDLIKKAEDLVKKEDATQEEVDKLAKEIEDEIFKIKEAGKEDPTTPDKPGKEDPTKPDKPGKEDPTKPDKPGKEDPTTPDKPGKEDPTTPDQPGKEDPTKPDKPGKEDPTKPDKPGKEDPTTPDKPGKEDPTKPGEKPGENPGTTPSNPGTVTPTPSVPGTTTPSTPAEQQKTTTRVAGADRIQTSVEVSKKYYESADTVIVANYEQFADSLSASALSKALKAPILLVQKDQLDSVVAQEIKRLGAKNVIVIGGEKSIDKTKIGLSQYNVRTIAGANRYETSAKIAQEVIKLTGTKKAVIASGEVFADALTVAPLANKNNMPILLVQQDRIPEEAKEVLKQIEEVIIVGGEKTISKEVENKLPNPTRIAGANRYETAKKIYEYGFKDRKEVNIANGTVPADSLVIGSIDCPILLAEANEIPEATKQAFEEAKFEKVNVFGGENSISESVVKELIK
ncbi:cell wall-binding repeat-containing protein [Finegoldia magna]|uniref:cell wall-binding repeat-containing protein n=6 Tax=Finegoldia magna TaxID=1260 RepID=UPI001D15B898|nr:cell wall-binding repeat-containing protein [Finegoldia magna]UEB34121.1 cell wall-binding repeat-containing protein [Finegoldia magna]